MDEIQRAQVEAAENVVVQGLRKKGLLPPEPPHVGTAHPAELAVMVVCNPCGSILRAQWVAREEDPKQAILCVEKCRCNIPPWRPIETAPKNGKRILIANGEDAVQGYWDSEMETEGGQCWRLDDPDMQRFEIVFDTEPTHWMPLPDPPEVKN